MPPSGNGNGNVNNNGQGQGPGFNTPGNGGTPGTPPPPSKNQGPPAVPWGSNQAPTGIAVTGGSVDEDALAGTVVATLDGIDPDAGDVFSFELTSDPSGLFEIVDDEVRLAPLAVLDYETTASYDIEVTVTDAAGLTHTETLTIGVNDVNEAPPRAPMWPPARMRISPIR